MLKLPGGGGGEGRERKNTLLIFTNDGKLCLKCIMMDAIMARRFLVRDEQVFHVQYF